MLSILVEHIQRAPPALTQKLLQPLVCFGETPPGVLTGTVSRALRGPRAVSHPVHLCYHHFCPNSGSGCLWPGLSCSRNVIRLCPRPAMAIAVSEDGGTCRMTPHWRRVPLQGALRFRGLVRGKGTRTSKPLPGPSWSQVTSGICHLQTCPWPPFIHLFWGLFVCPFLFFITFLAVTSVNSVV